MSTHQQEVASQTAEMRGPLTGERVLDIGSGIATSFCTKLLGDLGADVVKLETPMTGDRLRSRRTAPSGRPLADSPEFLYFNTSKRSVTLDLSDSNARPILERLMRQYDVVVADGPEHHLESLGLTRDQLRETRPDLVVTTISGFGSTGPYRDYKSNHLILSALSCWAVTCGLPDREPLQAGGSMAETVAGAYGAIATLGAVLARSRDGIGNSVDVSAFEAALTCSMMHPFRFEYWGELDARQSDYMTGPSFFVRCQDDYLGVNVLTEAQWETLCAFVGRPEMIADPRFTDYYGRLEYLDEIRSAVAAALAHRKAEEVFHEAQTWRLPFGQVVTPSSALDLTPHKEREYFTTHDLPRIGPLKTPRVPFRMARTPSLPTPAPELGADTDEVLTDLLGLTASEIDDLRKAQVIS